jgi:nucleotide-binding universal stress UspA family protein
MRHVLAALDRSPAAKPVLAAARALAALFDTEVTALHVRVDGADLPRSLTARAGVPLRIVDGDVAQKLIEAAEANDVAALVIGARGTPTDPRCLGATAVAVATTVAKPLVVVPPHADPHATYTRVLVPLEGNAVTSLAPRSLIELAAGAGLDVVVLHVLGLETMPAFTDQPQHEHTVWANEFLARHCPWGSGTARLETRLGRGEDLVPLVAHELSCDLIVLGWSQQFTAGRARVARATLERSSVPVMLVPIRAVAEGGFAAVREQPPR